MSGVQLVFGRDGKLWVADRWQGDWYHDMGTWGATMAGGVESPWFDTRKELRKWVEKRIFE